MHSPLEDVYLVSEILAHLMEDERLAARLVNRLFARAFDMLAIRSCKLEDLPSMLSRGQTLSLLRTLQNMDCPFQVLGWYAWRTLLSTAVDHRRHHVVKLLCPGAANIAQDCDLFDSVEWTEGVIPTSGMMLLRRYACPSTDTMEKIAERVGEWGNREIITEFKALSKHLLYDDDWILYGILSKNDYPLFQWYCTAYHGNRGIKGEYLEHALQIKDLDPRFRVHF